jgi:hypothetical protein
MIAFPLRVADARPPESAGEHQLARLQPAQSCLPRPLAARLARRCKTAQAALDRLRAPGRGNYLFFARNFRNPYTLRRPAAIRGHNSRLSLAHFCAAIKTLAKPARTGGNKKGEGSAVGNWVDSVAVIRNGMSRVC